MTHHNPFIAGRWASNTNSPDTIQSYAPATGALLPDTYPVSDYEELSMAVAAGVSAAAELSAIPPETIAYFLETYAAAIDANAAEICRTAERETALPYEPRLMSIELPRTTDQLRQAAEAVRDRSWTTATIDTRANLRSMFRPLGGPVVVFGPINFPLAYNAIAGGDFAAAIAAGNPVIAKAHPGHLTTTRLLAEAAQGALQDSGMPTAAVQLFYHCAPEDGLKLVAHPGVSAVGFTGSRAAGLALKGAADAAGKPIYLEMSSVNPVFMLPGALAGRGPDMARTFAASCLLNVGQFCTNPGLVIVPEGEDGEAFLAAAVELFNAQPTGTLLGPNSAASIGRSLTTLRQTGAELVTGGAGGGFAYDNTLLRVSGRAYLADPVRFQTEAFGPTSLIVFAAGAAEMMAIAAAVDGSLTGSIFTGADGAEDDLYHELAAVLEPRVGRLINDKMPTGVAVSPAMVHGGPYPATGHPGFTAVGIPASIHRFAALRCYDNVRPHRLPPELQDKNPTGEMWRLIDKQWSQGDVVR